MHSIAPHTPARAPLGATSYALCLVICLAFAGLATAQTPSLRQQLNDAAELVVRFEFDAAVDSFSQIRDQLNTGDPLYREATYGLAVAFQHRTPPRAEYIEQADQLFEEVATPGATDRLAARALLNRGRILELRDFQADPIRPQDAIAVYEQVMNRFSGQPIAHEAAFRKAGAMIQQWDRPQTVQQGVQFLEQWLDRHPDNPYAGGMHLTLYDHYYEADQPREALRHVVAGHAVGLPVPRAGEYYWQAGELAADLYHQHPELLDTAVRFYTITVVDTPSSGRAYQALDRLRALAEANPDADIEIPEFVFGRANATRNAESD